MVMLNIFAQLKNKYNIPLFISHINYNIHDNSKKAENLIQSYCVCNNLNYQINNVQINNKSNFEAVARNKRYEIFNSLLISERLKFICTAHHFDDQIETLWMKHKQKAPITSFRGILESSNNIWRPLLDIKKNEILKYAQSYNIKWVEDSTNSDMKFLRNKIRIQDVPKIKKENPLLIKELLKLKKIADLLFIKTSSVKQKLIASKEIVKFQNPLFYKIKLKSLLSEEDNIRKILIQSILNEFGFNLQSMTKLHWATFWQFLRNSNSGNEFTFNNGNKALMDRAFLFLYHPKNIINNKYKLVDGLKWYNTKFIFFNGNLAMNDVKNSYILNKLDLKNNLFVRNWKTGDRIIDSNTKKTKKISEIFKKNKLSKLSKMIHPIVVNEVDSPIWIPKFRHNNCYIDNNIEKVTIKWQQN